MAELLCAIYAKEHGLETKVARCFAFVGPHLPLDAHFAIGNFIRDYLRGEAITLTGDGIPRRSYLYAADLMVWLWTILFRGRSCVPYNVGSDESISVRATAEAVANHGSDPRRMVVLGSASKGPLEQYVPSTQLLRQATGVSQSVSLKEAVRKTIEWHSR